MTVNRFEKILGLCVLCAVALLAGCSEAPEAGAGQAAAVSGQTSIEESIKQIQGNDKMPAQAKQAAYARMRATYEQRGEPVPDALKQAEKEATKK